MLGQILNKYGNWIVAWITAVVGASVTGILYVNDQLILYGDAESHLNIAKRVVDSLTPGIAQLGGIWLPFPHLLMLPFTLSDWLWRSGLAGSIVSGTAFVVASVCIYKLLIILTKSQVAGLVAALAWISNPNILYLQATAMTELLLIALLMASIYYLLIYLEKHELWSLLVCAGLAMLATITRYDGWLLVIFEAVVLTVDTFVYTASHIGPKLAARRTEGYLQLFISLAFSGIIAWLIWDFMVYGDPLYFTNSEFSAKSQQQGWLARGELPAYHNLSLSIEYYLKAALMNVGYIATVFAIIGFGIWMFSNSRHRLPVLWLLSTPFVFYVVTLYAGQSIIFVPGVTPEGFQWQLFNARYGSLAVPVAAIGFGLLISPRIAWGQKWITSLMALVALFGIGWQVKNYMGGAEPIISYEDAVYGLSAAGRHNAEDWLDENYDTGLVLLDDYSRSISILRSGIPMESVVYIGNKPYWENALTEPEKVVEWIVMHQDDTIYRSLFDQQWKQDRLYANFIKVYTSPEILIFRKSDVPVVTYSTEN